MTSFILPRSTCLWYELRHISTFSPLSSPMPYPSALLRSRKLSPTRNKTAFYSKGPADAVLGHDGVGGYVCGEEVGAVFVGDEVFIEGRQMVGEGESPIEFLGRYIELPATHVVGCAV